ncbi:MAG: hypothetical protein SGPRY_013771 [Prymnesium sp.]
MADHASTCAPYNPQTDPYAPSEGPKDTLAEAPSSTPLMTSWARIAVLAMVAAMLYQRRTDGELSGGMVGGVSFPPEIKIYGVRQTFVGGAPIDATPLVASVYIAPGTASKEALSPFAGASSSELVESGFIPLLVDARLRQSFMLQWTAEMAGAEAVNLISEAAGPAREQLSSALRPVFGRQVPVGADLFLTCYSDALYVAYAEIEANHVRSTAPVAATIRDPSACPALFKKFLEGYPEMQQGVAEGFATRHTAWV